MRGYEIHIGSTKGSDCTRAWLDLGDRLDGAASADGRVMGCYMHGLFTSDAFRASYLSGLGGTAGTAGYDDTVEATLDALADHLERHLDLDALLELAE